MMMFLGPLLAAMVFAQAQPDRTATGEVVDDQGKPVADAQVVLYAPPLVWGKENAAEAQTRTDAQGQFHLKIPPLGRTVVNGVNYLAYRPGLAISANAYFGRPHRLILQKPEPRPVKIEGPDGQPIAGVRIAPLILYVFNNNIADIPETLAAPLAVVTGPDGRATLNYLAARDQLVAVRVSADPIGTQDFLLVDRPGRSSVEPVITIKLKKTSRIGGPDRGWSRPARRRSSRRGLVEGRRDGSGPVRSSSRGGPLRTGADGRFQTPDNLLVGSTYRIAVRAPGKEPILTDWITIGEQPRTLLPMKLLPLRTVSGRVVDRQGKPVANVAVFQTGDGPEQTATKTDTEGRFSLGGFRQGSVFLFARGEGFRFHGQLIRESDREVAVELTRTSERPTREMKMLPEPIPLEESRAMARRLVEPVWKVVVEKGDDRTKFDTLHALVNADPAGTLEKLESAKFADKKWEFRIRAEVAVALVDTDPEEAAAVAESIADPGPRVGALIQVVDELPAAQRTRKLALLDRAALQAKAIPETAERLLRMGGVAERWHELGEVEKAKSLFAEGLRIANQMHRQDRCQAGCLRRPIGLGRLARGPGHRQGRRWRGLAAASPFGLIDRNPEEGERIWKELRGGRRGLLETLCWKMARVDPGRARRVITGFPWSAQRPEMFLYLALGVQVRDGPVPRRARRGLRRLDRMLQEQPERFQFSAWSTLPIVERIDPARVPEVFWRDVASRQPFGNPRTISAESPSH